MKIEEGGIIIVAQPRSGSSNLMKSIASYYKKPFVFEPNLMKDENGDPTTDVVKAFPYWEVHHNKTEPYDYSKVLNTIKEYNTIILLSRRNKEEQIDSFYTTVQVLRGAWNRKWSAEDVDRESIYYRNYKEYFVSLDNIFDKLASDLNLEINYYEDVFKNKKLNIDIGLDLDFFSKELRLRQKTKVKKMLI